MKITNESGVALGGPWASLGGDPGLGEGETPVDCCASGEPPPDRAQDADVVTIDAPSTGGIVQSKRSPYVIGGSPLTETYDVTPTAGNLLVAFLYGDVGSVIGTAGWTMLDDVTTSAGEDSLSVWTADASAGDTVHVPIGPALNAQRLHLYEIDGSVDVYGSGTTDFWGGGTITGPTLTPTADGILIAAVAGRNQSYVGIATLTPDAPLSTYFAADKYSRGHDYAATQDVLDSVAVTPVVQNPPASPDVFVNDWGSPGQAMLAIVVIAVPSGSIWNVPAPLTVDDDDATYMEIEGVNVLRVDLGGPFRIVRSRVLAGAEFAGIRSYTITGANEADFSDGVVLDITSFTATGSFTPDDVELLWTTTESYRYFQLTGSLETRRVFTWNLYEPDTSLGQDHEHDAIEDDIADNAAAIGAHITDTDDAHDASAVSYDPTASGLTATDVQAAIDELAGGVASTSIWVPVMVEDGSSGLWYVAVTGDGDAVMTEVPL